MTNKTRKHIWPVALMSLAVFGVLVAVVALSVLPTRAAQAHGCDTGTAQQQAQCDTEHENAGLDHTDPDHSHDPDPGNGMTDDDAHASMPTAYALQALDNGARLDWDAPDDVATGAEVVGYRIHRDAWNTDPMHPINRYGDAAFNHISRGGSDTDYSDLGLSYETVYSYQVQAIVEYDVEHWWNNLNCVQMNDVVKPGSDEPQVGADTAGTAPYCVMYDDLSTAAKAVVQRAYDRYDEMYPTKMSYDRYALGELSMMRTIETADSGGRLQALLDAPTAVRDLELSTSCADSIVVSWSEPMDFGTVPAVDDNGVYVGPDYIGGRRAGKEEVGEDATSVTYHVQRMVNDGSWADVTASGMSYTDTNVKYGDTYKYRVRAMNVAGLYSPWTMVSEMLVEPDAPSRPSSLVVNLEQDQLTFELQWDPPGDPNGQLWRTDDDFEDAKAAGDYYSDTLSYLIEWQIGNGDWESIVVAPQPHEYSRNGLNTVRTQEYIHDPSKGPDGDRRDDIRGNEVGYRVAAIFNDCKPSSWNQADEVEVPDATVPEMPVELTAVASSHSQINLSWTEPSNGGADITGYSVEYSADGGTTWSDPVVVTATRYEHTGLNSGSTYHYRVSAINEKGNSDPATAMAATTTLSLGSATGLSATAGTAAGTAVVTWTPGANATHQWVWAAPADNSAGMWSSQIAGDAGSYTFSGLTSGMSYWFIGISGQTNAAGVTSYSNWTGWSSPVAIP